jgi:multidrug efflux system membrane fusion protein
MGHVGPDAVRALRLVRLCDWAGAGSMARAGLFSRAATLACLAVAALLALPAGPALGQAGGSGAVPVTVIKVQRQDVPEFARGIGTVQAYRSVLVRARVDGTLDKIAFREGQTVKPGDLLAEIDPRPYAATLAQARAKRAADAAQLDNARRDLTRYAALMRTNFASRQQVDTQQALVNQDAANIEGDDANIAAAALNLSFCSITAPIQGVVGLRLVDIGNLIHATDTSGIVSITQIHPIALVFTLPQDQLPAVRDAMDTAAGPQGDSQHAPLPVIAVTSEDGKELSRGHLITINNSIDTSTGTITLKAEFANLDNRLWPGQFVGAKLQLAVAHNALTLPPAAVQHGPDGLYVYVVKSDNTVAKQDVQIGYQDETASLIKDGLQGGESVVLSGQLRLQPGTKVDPHLQGGAKS